MNLLPSRDYARSGQIMAESCIGLALMSFAWIILLYSLFLADNHIRTAMAARHAAWYKGAGGGDMTAAQLDEYFFYQPGVSAVEYKQGDGIEALVLSGNSPSFSGDAGWPTRATVTFGVTNVNDSANPFPFDLLTTKVPFMPDSAMTNVLSVNSVCQWDQTSETWRSPGKALSGVFDTLKDLFDFKKLFKSIFSL